MKKSAYQCHIEPANFFVKLGNKTLLAYWDCLINVPVFEHDDIHAAFNIEPHPLFIDGEYRPIPCTELGYFRIDHIAQDVSEVRPLCDRINVLFQMGSQPSRDDIRRLLIEQGLMVLPKALEPEQKIKSRKHTIRTIDMTNHKTASQSHHQEAQTATGHEHHIHNMRQPQPASSHAETQDHQSACHAAAGESNRYSSASATTRRKCMHDAIAKRQLARLARQVEAGAFARLAVMHHIHKSLPGNPKATSSIRLRLWFLMHRKVAEVALRQAHRSIHRLGLKHVSDTTRFVEENCRWYLSFCRLSSRLLKYIAW